MWQDWLIWECRSRAVWNRATPALGVAGVGPGAHFLVCAMEPVPCLKPRTLPNLREMMWPERCDCEVLHLGHLLGNDKNLATQPHQAATVASVALK